MASVKFMDVSMLVSVSGISRDFLLNYTVCEVKYKGCLEEKPGVSGNYILYNLS
jgi:hypothetical protein